MIWLYATLISTVLFGIGSFLLKVGSHKNYSEKSMLLGLYVIGSVIFFMSLFPYQNFHFNWTLFTFSILVGLGSYYGNAFLVKAYNLGPACVTAPLMSLSIVLIIALSAFIYEEQITQSQYIGIFCMIIAASCLGFNFNNTSIKDKMWLVFVTLGIIFLFLREGGLKIAYESGLDNVLVLFFGYLLASLLAANSFVFTKENKDKNVKKAFLLGGTIGILSAVGMKLLALAISLGPTSIIVPIFSGRNIITILLILAFFKEKLSRFQWAAVGLMSLGIVFIS